MIDGQSRDHSPSTAEEKRLSIGKRTSESAGKQRKPQGKKENHERVEAYSSSKERLMGRVPSPLVTLQGNCGTNSLCERGTEKHQNVVLGLRKETRAYPVRGRKNYKPGMKKNIGNRGGEGKHMGNRITIQKVKGWMSGRSLPSSIEKKGGGGIPSETAVKDDSMKGHQKFGSPKRWGDGNSVERKKAVPVKKKKRRKMTRKRSVQK